MLPDPGTKTRAQRVLELQEEYANKMRREVHRAGEKNKVEKIVRKDDDKNTVRKASNGSEGASARPQRKWRLFHPNRQT